jgi:hypothetical protein
MLTPRRRPLVPSTALPCSSLRVSARPQTRVVGKPVTTPHRTHAARLSPAVLLVLLVAVGPAHAALHGLHTQAPPAQTPAAGNDAPTTLADEVLPSGARLYVAPMPNGFDAYVIAGLQQKKVPVVVVALREKAEYELSGVSETDQAGWAKILFLRDANTSEMASVKIVNLKTGNVVFAYSVKKGSSMRGKQSAGESVAKHIKQKIDKGT